MEKIEVGRLDGNETLRDIIEYLEIRDWLTHEGDTLDVNLMTLKDLETFLHILSNGAIDVEFVP